MPIGSLLYDQPRQILLVGADGAAPSAQPLACRLTVEVTLALALARTLTLTIPPNPNPSPNPDPNPNLDSNPNNNNNPNPNLNPDPSPSPNQVNLLAATRSTARVVTTSGVVTARVTA